MNKILIVDDDSTTSFILGKNLTKQGYSVVTANNAITGAEFMKNEDFNLVISDIDMPEISGLDFLLWIKKHSPQSQVIIMTGNNSSDIRNYVNTEGALKYLEKPINIKELNQFIKENIKKGFSGSVNNINIFDFIHIIILSGKQKLILVKDEINHHSGKLFIKSGKIIHAEFNKLEGQKAFNAIMQMENGAFSEISWTEPERETINLASQELLLEASKFINNENKPGPINLSAPPKSLKPFSEKILIVDDDPITPLIIEKYLVKKGFTVATAGSAMEGAEILKKENFSLVITDLNMPQVNGLEFLLWIKQHNPKSQVIIITAGGSSEIKKFANQKGAVGYFEKPVNLKELDSFIAKNVLKKGFSGDIQDIDLLDFIQIIAFSGKNRLISVNDPVVNQKGLIYLENGQIIHSEMTDLKGEEAFYAMINFKSGIFSYLPWSEPDEKTIDTPITTLLKKALKIKEDNAGKPRPEDKALIGVSRLKAKPRYLEKALEQREALQVYKKETDPVKQLTIYESGVALGIVIGRTSKDQVISIMKQYSKADGEAQRPNQMLLFEDVSFSVLFNDDDIVEEFTAGKYYKGETSLGIGIDDLMEEAIKIYGKPRTCTVKGAVWDNIAFFSMDNRNISSIRVRNLNFFNNESEKLVNTSVRASSVAKVEPMQKKTEPKLVIKKTETIPEQTDEQTKITKKSLKRKLKSKSESDSEKGTTPDNGQPETNKKFIIHEAGNVLDIHIGRSTLEDVKEIMEKYSKADGETKISKNILSYEDISANFLFDNNGRVKEINLGKNFPGATEKGIKPGDKLEKVLELYGFPQYKTTQSAIWHKFAVFCEESDFITCIRLRDK